MKIKPLYVVLFLLASVFVVCGTMAVLQLTEPYAVKANGEKVQEPWAVMAGDEELFVVENEQEGQAVVEGIKEHYAADTENLQDVFIDPEISVVKKELSRKGKAPEITDAAHAVAEVVVQNESGLPLVNVTTTEYVEKEKVIKYETKYKENDTLYEGEEKETVKGKNGKKIITKQITKINGKVIGTEVIGTEITEKAVPKIIHKGTKKRLAARIAMPEQTTVAETEKTERTKPEEQETVPEETQEDTPTAATPARTASDDGAESSDPSSAVKDPGGNQSNGENSSRPDSSKDDSDQSDKKEPTNGGSGKEESGSGTAKTTGQKVADYACRFIGNPYVWGGTSLTNGADCSGFVMSVYKHFGVSLPRTSSQQAYVGRGISYKNARPGDIVCYPGHVAIYIGKGKIVHASTPASGIKVSPATYRPIKAIRRVI